MRTLLVFGDKKFRLTIKDDDKITFGPFSPPTRNTVRNHGDSQGTLRVYDGKSTTIKAVFAGVSGFRDVTLDYEEEVAREEGAVIWKSDQHGYHKEEKINRKHEWQKEPKRLTRKTKGKDNG